MNIDIDINIHSVAKVAVLVAIAGGLGLDFVTCPFSPVSD